MSTEGTAVGQEEIAGPSDLHREGESRAESVPFTPNEPKPVVAMDVDPSLQQVDALPDVQETQLVAPATATQEFPGDADAGAAAVLPIPQDEDVVQVSLVAC